MMQLTDSVEARRCVADARTAMAVPCGSEVCLGSLSVGRGDVVTATWRFFTECRSCGFIAEYRPNDAHDWSVVDCCDTTRDATSHLPRGPFHLERFEDGTMSVLPRTPPFDWSTVHKDIWVLDLVPAPEPLDEA